MNVILGIIKKKVVEFSFISLDFILGHDVCKE